MLGLKSSLMFFDPEILNSWGVLPSLYLVGLSWRRSNDAVLHCIAVAAGKHTKIFDRIM